MGRLHGRKNNTADYLKLGDHNVISDINGQKYKASECKILSGSQKGLLCHDHEWNHAQPQLYIPSKADNMDVRNVRTPAPDQFPPTPSPEDL